MSEYRDSSGGTEAFPSRLVITYMSREYVVTPERPFTIGSEADADLHVSGAWVSP